MTEDSNQFMFNQLYNNIYSMFCCTPDGKPMPNKVIQLGINKSIKPEDYCGMIDGDNRCSENFSNLVDQIPSLGVIDSGSGENLGSIYSSIINSINVISEPNDYHQEILYNNAISFLYEVIETKDTISGETKTTLKMTPAYEAYCNAKHAYLKAVMDYKINYTEDFGHSIKSQSIQRQYIAKIHETYEKMNFFEEIQEALNTIAASIHFALKNAINKQKELLEASKLTAHLRDFYVSYSIPSINSWCERDVSNDNFYSDFEFIINKSSEKQKISKDNENLSLGLALKLFNLGTQGKLDNSTIDISNEQSEIKISGQIGIANVIRPWFDPIIFSLNGWKCNLPNTIISSGNPEDKNALLPMYTTSIIVVKSLTIESLFKSSKIDETTFNEHGNTGITIGPFTIGPKYTINSEDFTCEKTNNGYRLTNKGVQVIGFINEIVPACPKEK